MSWTKVELAQMALAPFEGGAGLDGAGGVEVWARVEPGGEVERVSLGRCAGDDLMEYVRLLADRCGEARGMRRCLGCGRWLPARKGKVGRMREMHRECSALFTRLDQVSRIIGEQLRFAPDDPGARKEIRGRLAAILNQQLQWGHVPFSSEDGDFS